MNNQFGGFDLDSFGTQFQGNGTSASIVPNTQQQRHGPCMENYDPSRVLGAPAPYNSTARGSHTSTNTASSLNTSNHSSHSNSNTHQTFMPSAFSTTAVSTSGAAPPAVAIASRHGSIHNGTRNSIAYSDLNSFDPQKMQPIHQQQQPVVNQHLHQHQHVHHHHHHHLSHPEQQTERQYRKQQQRHQQRLNHSNHLTGTTNSAIQPTTSYSSNIFAQPQHISSLDQHQIGSRKEEKPPSKPEPWMEDIKVTVSGVSLEPLTAFQIIQKLQDRMSEVLTRYLPCVHFLVQCQQDLRKGLAAAQQKRLIHHMLRESMTPRQFYATYISNLPKRFYQENRRSMSSENLNTAYKELQKLCANAKAAESQGCEGVKNTFLGGMKDGESWGLRKWLSKQGGALHICNDTECLLNSCQKLDRSKDTTIKLAARLRPLAKSALNKLQRDVPSSYQERSSAHPYLPFFHRLESALRGMANFDPEDDDVICIDDDDDEVIELKANPPPPPPSRRKSSNVKATNQKSKRKASEISKSKASSKQRDEIGGAGVTDSIGGGLLELEDSNEIEVLDSKSPIRKRQKAASPVGGSAELLAAVTGDDSDYMKALLSTFDDDNLADFDGFDRKSSLDNAFPMEKDAYDLASGVDQLARLFESDQQDIVRPDCVKTDSFWDNGKRYPKILRMFSDMLRDPDTSVHFLDPVSEERWSQDEKPSYSSVVKHPLCFRDIVTALLEDFSSADNTLTGNNGVLSEGTLSSWNMYNGKDLLQAIDLVLLNFLAYEKACEGGGKSSSRSLANKLRKKLWANIKQFVDEGPGPADSEARKKHTPIRRGEGSGFVVHKSAKA